MTSIPVPDAGPCRERSAPPHYRASHHEVELCEAAVQQRLPVLLIGPTGAGKTRLAEAIAASMCRQLRTVVCSADTAVADLIGREVVVDGRSAWRDGPVTAAVRAGAVLHLEGLAAVRSDVLQVLDPLLDHRRALFVDRLAAAVHAADGFAVLASHDPSRERALPERTRQRFVAIPLDRAPEHAEADIVATEAGVAPELARDLVGFAGGLRALDDLGLDARITTRLLIAAARLIRAGVATSVACEVAIVRPATDDPDVAAALLDAVLLTFGRGAA